MKTIWKFTLKTTDEQVIEMPRGAKLLTVQMQDNRPQLWALVDSVKPNEQRTIATFGTGNPAEDGEYIGTYQMRGGELVFHVFDITK
jgi:hypothetical protein